MTRKSKYGQFCPVAKAAEVVAERWTPLVVRELLVGSKRFSEIQRGVPLMSPSLLSQRLRELENAGIIERRKSGRSFEYLPTEAGRDLMTVIEALGTWGKRWTGANYPREELDPSILMLDMRRNVDLEAIPVGQTIVHFRFTGAPPKLSRYWLILQRPEADVCLDDPGPEPDLFVDASLRDFVAAWMGDLPFDRAIRRRIIELTGPRDLCRDFHRWFHGNLFSHIDRASSA